MRFEPTRFKFIHAKKSKAKPFVHEKHAPQEIPLGCERHEKKSNDHNLVFVRAFRVFRGLLTFNIERCRRKKG
jgi:hypothetical protein